MWSRAITLRVRELASGARSTILVPGGRGPRPRPQRLGPGHLTQHDRTVNINQSPCSARGRRRSSESGSQRAFGSSATQLSEPVPVRFPETLLAEVRERAEADDRSVSNWIR